MPRKLIPEALAREMGFLYPGCEFLYEDKRVLIKWGEEIVAVIVHTNSTGSKSELVIWDTLLGFRKLEVPD